MLLKNNAKRIWRLKKVALEIFPGRNFAKIAKKKHFNKWNWLYVEPPVEQFDCVTE